MLYKKKEPLVQTYNNEINWQMKVDLVLFDAQIDDSISASFTGLTVMLSRDGPM